MKLSKKGEGKEFENCVVLTVDDAKRIINSLQRPIKAHEELSRLTNGWIEVSIEENDINMLKERIELTENTNE